MYNSGHRTTGEICGLLAVIAVIIIVVSWSFYGIINLIINPPQPDTSNEDACSAMGGHLYTHEIYVRGYGAKQFKVCASDLDDLEEKISKYQFVNGD